ATVRDARLLGSRFLHTLDHNTVRQRNGERNTILWAEVSRDVALAGRIFNQIDVSGAGGDMDTSGYFDFGVTRKRDHKLPRRAGVPLGGVRAGGRGVAGIGSRGRRPYAELRSSGLQHLRCATAVQLQ